MKQIFYLLTILNSLFVFASGQNSNSAPAVASAKDFAGQYVYSSGFVGARYKLLSDGRFEYSSFSDCCDPVWKESGTYTFKDNQLHFKISEKTLNEYNLLDPKQATEAFRKLYKDETANVQAGDIRTEYGMHVVKWGERIYLIEPERLHLFAAAVNFGIEPRQRIINDNFLTTTFYLRRGDEVRPISGKPSVSESLIPFLHDSPLKATITKNESQEKEKIYIINKGSSDGIKVGMSFVGENVEPEYNNLLWVISVDEKSAKVKSFHIFRAYEYQLNTPLTTKIVRKQ